MDFLHSEEDEWRKDAACLGLGVEAVGLFYGDKWETESAKALCATCPVREPCLDGAIARNEPEGVWGGLAADERRRLGNSLTRRNRGGKGFSGGEAYKAALITVTKEMSDHDREAVLVRSHEGVPVS